MNNEFRVARTQTNFAEVVRTTYSKRFNSPALRYVLFEQTPPRSLTEPDSSSVNSVQILEHGSHFMFQKVTCSLSSLCISHVFGQYDLFC
jgi:hypothetical protein